MTEKEPEDASGSTLLFCICNIICYQVSMVIQRHLPFIQKILGEAFYPLKDDGPDGNPDDHANKSKEAAEQKDGEQYPEAAETGGSVKYAGTDDITVQLLKDQDKDGKIQSMDRTLYQYKYD